MNTETVLFLLVLIATAFSLTCWPISIEKLARTKEYPFIAHLMTGLAVAHWLVAIGILLWFSPSTFSLQAVLDSWQLISTATVYLLLGTRYWHTANWAEGKAQQRQRIRKSLHAYLNRG